MIEPIAEIRALLLQFEKTRLKDFYLRTGEWRVFMARPDGGANPMVEAPAVVVAESPGVGVKAPHLGLFEPAIAPGDMVEGGALIGRLDVLGRKTDVVADRAGRVVSVAFAANDLVEYGETLAVIATA